MTKTRTIFLLVAALGILGTVPSNAQEMPLLPDMSLRDGSTIILPAQARSEGPVHSRATAKKPSEYTAEEWGNLIDSTWGPGQSAAEQRQVFDTFWDVVDRRWAGFPNFPVSWDSLRNVYRPRIDTGLSRGRFYALMSRMWLALLEQHTLITDLKVDTIHGATSLNYKTGVPLLILAMGWWDLLGAPVTSLPDSSGLVYRAVPGNPLGLQPGDVVLGYEGIPWTRLYKQLVDSGVPVSRYWASSGSTPESRLHANVSSVGWNWGMFETIDVVKYSTGDTVHLPTAPLATLTQTLWASDQVPIPGVSMPQACFIGLPTVTWGVVEATNIGYVYVWDWTAADVSVLFRDAISDLRYTRKVEGLIIDFRMNWGGLFQNANLGYAQLFGSDPTFNVSRATRSNPTDHLGFTLSPTTWGFTPTDRDFDHPIAVLIGPACLSAGDHNAFRMRFHPMARLFGRPTNGAHVAGQYVTDSLAGGWRYQVPTNITYSNLPGEGYLVHKGVQPDEEVWLTRDGVAKGEDDVVKRALQWINGLSYAHDSRASKTLATTAGDTVLVTTTVENPSGHSLRVSAILSDAGVTTADSAVLFDDGLHGDGSAADNVYGGTLTTPPGEGYFDIAVRTDDLTQGTFRRLPKAQTVFFVGPVTLDSVAITTADTVAGPGKALKYKLFLKNHGLTATVKNVTAKVRCTDTTQLLTNVTFDYGDLAPGQLGNVATVQSVKYDARPGNYAVNFEVTISTNGIPAWTGWFSDIVTGVGEPTEVLPTEFALAQNYPNPFNPNTTIRYEMPTASTVRVSICDLLGREVAVLVNEQKAPGTYTTTWDASGFPSGVYFCTLRAGDYRQTKRMILLR